LVCLVVISAVDPHNMYFKGVRVQVSRIFYLKILRILHKKNSNFLQKEEENRKKIENFVSDYAGNYEVDENCE